MRQTETTLKRTEQWRAELLNKMLRVILVLGVIVGVPSIIFAVSVDDIATAILDVVALVIVGIVTFNRRLGFRARAIVLLVTAYLLGLFLLFAIGLVGHAYLLALPVMAAVLFGLGPAIFALAANAATLTVVGILGYTELWGPIPQFGSLSEWLLISINFMFLNAVTAVFCAQLLHRLESSLGTEHSLAESLANEQAELRSKNAELQRSEEVRIAFLRATSHELRTPLTAIIAIAETLRNHGARLPDDQHALLVDRLAVNGDRLHRLIADLLDVDRLAEGLVTAKRQRRDLRELITNVVGEVDAGGREVQLDLQPIDAEIDAPKIERVIFNLVANAVRHTPIGSAIRVQLLRDDDTICMRVDDTGPGIDPRYLDIIFEPFVQGPERHNDAQPGTGLGLSLAQGLVRLHGGLITAMNLPAGGARFEVRLPAATTAEFPERPVDGGHGTGL